MLSPKIAVMVVLPVDTIGTVKRMTFLVNGLACRGNVHKHDWIFHCHYGTNSHLESSVSSGDIPNLHVPHQPMPLGINLSN